MNGPKDMTVMALSEHPFVHGFSNGPTPARAEIPSEICDEADSVRLLLRLQMLSETVCGPVPIAGTNCRRGAGSPAARWARRNELRSCTAIDSKGNVQ